MVKNTSPTEKTETPVVISEGITITNVNEIRKKLQRYFKGKNNPIVKLHNIVHLDLAGIQLLHSLKKTCIQQNKKLRLEMNFSNDIIALLNNSGFNNLLTIKDQ